MELILKRQPVVINEKILNTALEQPIELDATLPDYYPDIVKIISCIITPSLSVTDCINDRLILGGTAMVCVCYADENGAMYTYEGRVPFEKTTELKKRVDTPVICADVSVSYVNCRAVSNRRLDVRGALSIPVKVCGGKEEMIISDVENDNIEVKQSETEYEYLSGQCIKNFTVKEELSPLSGVPEIGRILRKCASAVVSDFKLITGKIIMKGEAYLTIVYTPTGSDEMCTMHYSLPFSQILDCRYAEESSACEMNIRTLTVNVDIALSDGVPPVIEAELGFCCEANIITKSNFTMIEDCYSTEYEITSQKKTLPIYSDIDVITEDVHIKEIVDLPEGVNEICDIWCKSATTTLSCEEESTAMCKMLIGMVVKGEDMQYIERTVSAKIPLGTSCEVAPDYCMKLIITKCTASGVQSAECEVHIDCMLSGYLATQSPVTVVDAIELGNAAVATMSKNSLIIYYPYSKEPVWNIAKKFGTTVDRIKSRNNLKDDYVNKGDVIILTK